MLFDTEVGREHLLRRRGVAADVVAQLPALGLSSICNVLAAIKTAKYYGLGADDVIVTVATDGAAMYSSERELALEKYFPDGFDEVGASEVFGEHLLGATTDHLRELTHEERERIFNLGYYTWVEQQGGHDRGLPGAPRSGLLDADPCQRDRVGRADRRVQRPHRSAGDAVSAGAVSRLVCAGCGAEPARDDPYPFRCPKADGGDDVDHVLRRVLDFDALRLPPDGAEANPFVRYRWLLHAYHTAVEAGMSDEDFGALVQRLDERVAAVDGHGFATTPFERSAELSDRLGFSAEGGVWVKDETGNVSGSHKARHLFGVLIWLEVAERLGFADPSARPRPRHRELRQRGARRSRGRRRGRAAAACVRPRRRRPGRARAAR